ncbi:MAG TPA: IS4 family transposase [Reyranella sp.]|nr:IS4 family transposase [Reyranella sp.]
MRYSRFLNSAQVTAAEMLTTAAAHCAARVAGRHVLAIQDTSEINYQAHAGRCRGLGLAGNGRDLGFFLHPCLAVDAAHGGIIGLAGGQVWKRPGKIKTDRKKRAIADKESRRWLEVARDSIATLGEAAAVTVVCDREGDIYDLFAAVADAGPRAHLLVRAARDRTLGEGDELLFAHVDALPERHRYAIEVPEKPGRKKRTATVALGFGRIDIRRPARAAPELPDRIGLNVVIVREIDPPAGAAPVHWVLLTTHAIDSLDAAIEIVRWYRLRWHIEQLFRTLKSDGFDVEDSQVVDGHALMNLVTAALVAAMLTLQLTLARDGATRQPVSDGFTEAERRVLRRIERGLPGRTAKQLNPHPPDRLAWAAWIIARLGGWTGYASQKPPGPKTIHLGLTQFNALAQGWILCEQEV